MTNIRPKPAAWFDSIDCPINGKIAVICSYCPDRREAEAAAHPLAISHGVCPRCLPAALAEARALSNSASS